MMSLESASSAVQVHDVSYSGHAVQILGDVPLLAVDERPNLAGLDRPAGQFPQVPVAVGGACRADVEQQLRAGVDPAASRARSRAQAAALRQHSQDGGELPCAQPVHTERYA
jgi:hypothetical protein